MTSGVNIGIDTLKLRLTDFDLSRANLTVQPNARNLQTGDSFTTYLSDTHGNRFKGSKAFLNTETLNVDVSGNGTFVHFSVPKALTGDNTHPLNEGDTLTALDKVQAELKRQGIGVDIYTGANLSRIDVFKPIHTDCLTTEYSDVLAHLRATRSTKRDYGTTYAFMNGQRQTIAYDKDVERARRLHLPEVVSHNLRVEARHLKVKPIKDCIRVEALGDFLASYDSNVRDLYTRNVKDIFRYESIEEAASVYTSDDYIADLLRLKEVKGKLTGREATYYLQAVGVQHINMPSFLRAFGEVSDNSNKRDLMRNIEDKVNGLRLRTTTIGRKLAALYSELRRKVAA